MSLKGTILDLLDKPEEALIWYDKALDIDGNYTNAMYNKGLVLDELGKPEEGFRVV